MVSPVNTTSAAKRAAIVLTLLAMLAAGCGSSVGGSAARASIDLDPAPGSTSGSCATTVLSVLGDVATRVYNEGVASERTEVALRLIEHSIPLREAVERGDSQGARSAARARVLRLRRSGSACRGAPSGSSGAPSRAATPPLSAPPVNRRV